MPALSRLALRGSLALVATLAIGPAPGRAQAAAATPAPDVAPVAADAASASLRATEEAFAKSFADRDATRFASFLHPDAVFDVNGREPLRGRAAVMARWSKYLASETPPFSWRPVVAEAHDGIGVTAGPVYDRGGKWVGNFSSVWQQQPDGSWKIVFDGEPPCAELGASPAAAGTP